MRRSIGIAVTLAALVALGVARWLSRETGAQRVVRGQPAPELAAGPWINSGPLTMARLRGRVVFLEFWTYG